MSKNGTANSINSPTNGLTAPIPSNGILIMAGSLVAFFAIVLIYIIIIVIRGRRRSLQQSTGVARNQVTSPRKSIAKPLSRGMLELIPIYKVGESKTDDLDNSLNLELGTSVAPCSYSGRSQIATTVQSCSHIESGEKENPTSVEQNISKSHGDLGGISFSQDGSQFNCSICTEELKERQDMRVLPCSHRYHPECVDPWLLNISGTCPLCRTNLNPTSTLELEIPPSSFRATLAHAGFLPLVSPFASFAILPRTTSPTTMALPSSNTPIEIPARRARDRFLPLTWTELFNRNIPSQPPSSSVVMSEVRIS